MADLDDFFAKKDKKKSKSKKFTTAEDLVKRLEDTSKKPESSSKSTSSSSSSGSSLLKARGNNEEDGQNNQEQEDEWKEFQEERKDYSGLKIGQLQINDDDAQADGEQGSEAQSDSEGNADAADRKTGPWKAVPEVQPVQPPPPVEQQPDKPKIYRPPAVQNQLAKVNLRQLNSRTAPDISSEEYFPTLGTAPPKPDVPAPRRRLDPGFEEVKHGSRSAARPSEVAQNSPVAVGNRFHSLAGDTS